MKRIAGAVFVVFLAAGLCSPAFAADQGLAKVMAGVKAKYKKITDFSADYTRVTKTRTMGPMGPTTRRVRASGRIYFKKPMMVRMDQQAPRVERLTTDGRTVWWYRPSRKELVLYSMAKQTGSLRPVLDFLDGLSGLDRGFTIRRHKEKGLDPKLMAVVLEPKKPRPDLKYLIFYLLKKDLLLKRFVMVNFMGARTEYTFYRHELTKKLKASWFRFKRPRGVRVIDRRGRRRYKRGRGRRSR